MAAVTSYENALYCGKGGNSRMRRKNNLNLEEGMKTLRRENNKIVEEEENKNEKGDG